VEGRGKVLFLNKKGNMKNLFLLFLLVPLFAFSKPIWHSWEDTPKENELYFTVWMVPGYPPSERQFLILQNYHENIEPIKANSMNGRGGWFAVSNEDILQLFQEGSKIIYLPQEKKSISYIRGFHFLFENDFCNQVEKK
jgi:hypothetical protein